MINKEVVNLASKYLSQKNIYDVEPGELGCTDGDKQEVIFLDSAMLDPKVATVDPPDVRVWVNTKTKEVTLIYQM